MKIAFTSKGTSLDSQMDSTFGRANYLVFLDTETNNIESYDNSETANQAHGAGPKASKELIERNIELLITGNMPGGNALPLLTKAGIEIYVANNANTLKEALAEYQSK